MKKQSSTLSFVEITKLAKTNPEQASREIKAFVTGKFNLDITEIKINDSAVSLNSVNGFISVKDGIKYFFKFHAEEGETETVGEYYRAGVLERAGFPIISPLWQSSKPGQQFLIYPQVSAPTFFDILEKMDDEFIQTGKYDEESQRKILQAEEALNDVCAKVAKKTLKSSNKKVVEGEPIWQLFYRRLVSTETTPRGDLFYTGKTMKLPDDLEMNFNGFSQLKWKINGIEFSESLAEIIESAKEILNPKSCENWATITAHGDDHNGNKFYFENQTPALKYFDPAFSGEAIPALLAFVKTTFHDTFAHPFWLYDPKKIEKKLELDFEIRDGVIEIQHNFELEKVAPLRVGLLKQKFEQLWNPLLEELCHQKLLPDNYQNFIKKALFCCPFFVLNLIDSNQFSPKNSIFALSRAVEMGTFGEGNLIDNFLQK